MYKELYNIYIVSGVHRSSEVKITQRGKNMKKNVIKVTLIVTILVLAALALVSCAHSHSFTAMKVLKVATCSEEGEIEYTCDCGHVEKSKLEKLDHNEGAWRITKAATCDEAGSRSTYCKSCDQKIDTESIPATGHDLVKVEAKAATCAEVGFDAYEYCTGCGYTTYKEKDKVGHTPGAAATCTAPQYCKVCEQEIEDALGHVRVVTAGKEATCEKEGLSDLVECSRCDKVIEEQITIPKREHAPATVMGYAATCVEEGLSDGIICLVCEEELVKQVELPENNEHDYSSRGKCTEEDCGYDKNDDCEHEDEDEDESWLKTIRDVSATCSKYGLTEGEYCTECGYITEEPEVVEPSEHNIEVTKGYPATLTKPGLTDGEYCKKCKIIVKQQELIPVIEVGANEEAANIEANGGKLSYTVNKDSKTCTVTGIGTCTAKNIIIPTTIDSYRVTDIGAKAFYSDTSIVSVVISDSVETIGDKAFAACTKLESIKLSDSIEIDADAFDGSSKLELEFTHSLVYVSKVEAECDEPGRKAHYVCIHCGNRFSDKAATTPIYKIQIVEDHDFDDEEICEECGDSLDEVYIVEIEKVSGKTVKLGTSVKDLKLPATVTVTTDDEETHTLSVVWDTSAYKSNEEGSYTLTGYVLTGGYEVGKKVDDEISITVKVND